MLLNHAEVSELSADVSLGVPVLGKDLSDVHDVSRLKLIKVLCKDFIKDLKKSPATLELIRLVKSVYALIVNR